MPLTIVPLNSLRRRVFGNEFLQFLFLRPQVQSPVCQEGVIET